MIIVMQQVQGVPKVIVMGSSTASETTINTSTDSSNTIVTTMTATDGDNTEDSLDLIEPLDSMSNTDHSSSGNNDPAFKQQNPLQPTPATPKTPPTAKQQTPSSVAKSKESTRFLFDLQQQQSVDLPDPFDPPPPPTSPEKQQQQQKKHNFMNGKEERNVDVLMDEQIEALKMEAKRRNSYKAAQRDYDMAELRSGRERKTYQKPEENGRLESPSEKSPSPRVRAGKKSGGRKQHQHQHQHSPGSKRDKFTYDEKHIAKYRMTPPLPDLRVDFFAESVDGCQQQQQQQSVGVGSEKRGSVCLNKCLREVGAQLEQSSATSPINVTTNPLENSVQHFGARKATIVVQQPSLSLDQQGNVATIVLKNGSEFVSNVVETGAQNTNKLSLKKQKEENMKQLLDVANNLTLEEIHDFEMRFVRTCHLLHFK